MSELKGACVIGQSGGPTSVINASAYGVIRTALDNPNITRVYGAANGIRGVIDDILYVMDEEDDLELSYLLNTPSSALGSCRYKLQDSEIEEADYKRILNTFKKHNIRYFFYNGGNDSMDTCNKISKYMQKVGYECRIMGVPKTIDNDLWGTDHCPGFPSAAKYVATSCMEIYNDARVYDTDMICILEVMGRHAGWLTAASAIACSMGQGPDLIYLPEVDFDLDKFIVDVDRIYKEKGKCIVAVSEGIHDKEGKLISEYLSSDSALDSFGHKQLGGLASTLVTIVKERLKVNKIRGIEFSLLQRCAAHCASGRDVDEAFMAGKTAVESAIAGITDKMVAFERDVDENGEYVCRTKLVDLADTANREKKVPLEWINAEGNGVTQEYIDYVLPLVQGNPHVTYEMGLPRFARLKKIIEK
ncbi:MAG: 6-phosphofructokinase [Christensenellaceae bacterium]|nr:6-phosphofructokinase [Christensenellaceae bacterium]